MRRPQNYGYEPVPNQSDDLEIENERFVVFSFNKISFQLKT